MASPPAGSVHLRYIGILAPHLDNGIPIEGLRVYAPFDVIGRLGASKRIASWRDGKAFESIAKKAGEAHEILLSRVNPIIASGVTDPNDPRLLAALKGPSFCIDEAEFDLLLELLEIAGDASAFEDRYAAARFSAIELRLFSSLFESLTKRLASARAGAPIPSAEEPDHAAPPVSSP